jgi:hypothetical protein
MDARPVVYDSSQCLWEGVRDRIITSQDVYKDGRLRVSIEPILKENVRPRTVSTTSKRSNVDVSGAVALPVPTPMANEMFKMPLSPIPASPNAPKSVYAHASTQNDVHIQVLLKELQDSERTIKRMGIIQHKLETVIEQLVELLKTK